MRMTHDLRPWTHEHQFHLPNPTAERRTAWVMWITLATMGLEIAAGLAFNSMALLADGWHMSSHAVAIGLSVWAYRLSRQHAADARYAFGTWKIEVLGGFASALLLLGVAGLMVWGSVERLLAPQEIHYGQALGVAALGLLVNLGCALLLSGHGEHSHHGHDHGHDHAHDHHHGHAHAHEGDLNLRAAYVHVLTDALTSVLAMVALAAGWRWGWAWLDPVMGLVGAGLVAVWARGLLVSTANVLLDREMDAPVVEEIREVITEQGASSGTHLTDLHVWRVAKDQHACALTLLTHDTALTAEAVRGWLSVHEELVHCTIEIHVCPDLGHRIDR